jgi:hypothetical protein
MVPCICIEKIILTEYNRSVRVIDLKKDNQKLYIRKSSRLLIEDALCNIFSNNGKVYIRARWESRECSIREIVEFNENLKDNTYGVFR